MARSVKPEQVTMRDLARLVGVSIATVSRTLSTPAKVAAVTRAKVEQAVKALEYQSPLSLSQPTTKARTILIVISADDVISHNSLLYSLIQQSHQRGYQALLLCTPCPSTECFSHLALCRQIVGSLLLPAADEVMDELQSSSLWRLPKVMLNAFMPQYDMAYVGMDNLSAAFYATDHLIKSGHWRIACIAASNHQSAYRERTAGYLQALKRHNILFNPAYLIALPMTIKSGLRAINNLLAQPQPPGAVLCHHELQAIGVINGARQQGIAIPDGLSVIGFEENGLGKYCRPALSCMSYSSDTLAGFAWNALIKQMQQPETTRQQVNCQFIHRGSTTE